MPHNSLPDPHGPLNKQVPSSSIEEANKEVDICYKATSTEKKRSLYSFTTPEQDWEVYMRLKLGGPLAWYTCALEDTCAYLAPKVQAPGKLSESTIL